MFEIYVIFFTLFLILISNYISKKKQFLTDKKFNIHKSFASKSAVPITGGFIFLMSSLFFLNFEYQYLKIFLILIFLIGFLSDINYLVSPIKRLFLQIISILIFVNIDQIFINSIRIEAFDFLLTNIYFKYFFTLFCFLVLINGSNFMDGINTLLIGYFLALMFVTLISIEKFNLSYDVSNYYILALILFLIFWPNFFGKLISGDSGAYLISFVIGYFLIDLVNSSNRVSPYFVSCLLWYPAYECLFSIIRKLKAKKSVAEPDNRHLHQLIFLFLKRKFNLKENFLNTLTGLSVNSFNLIIFYAAFQNVSQTKNLVLINILSLFFYNLIYYYLNKSEK